MSEIVNNESDNIRTFYNEMNSISLISSFLKNNITDKCLILCIGTDKYIGDCLGPIVGTFLTNFKMSLPIFGTLENPVHAMNLKENITCIKNKYPHHKIIAVDACLGDEENIGRIQVKKGCIYPGKGVGKSLPPIGDISIIGIVDSSEPDEFFMMHNVRLNMVMKMSEVIAKAIQNALDM